MTSTEQTAALRELKTTHAGRLLFALALVLTLAAGFSFQPVSDVSSHPFPAGHASAQPQPHLTAAEVVARMSAMDEARHSALQAYDAVRHYHLEYHGLGHKTADMDVSIHYNEPAPKQFRILRESGSGLLRHHVLEPLVREESEEATIQNREGSALVPENYDFTLLDYPRPDGPQDYVLGVKPRIKDARRFLFRGKIWVNASDFGLEKAEGQSVRSPSWWVTRFDFRYQSRKIGPFWMPLSSHARSSIRLFGHAELEITDNKIELTAYSPVQPLDLASIPSAAAHTAADLP